MGVGIAVTAIVNRPVARAPLEQTAEIEDAGALLVQVKLTGKGELVALGHEFVAAAICALVLVPEVLAIPGRRAVGENDAGIGDTLGACVALEVARDLVAQRLAALVGGGRDSRRASCRCDAARIEMVDGHGVCPLSGKRVKRARSDAVRTVGH